MIECFLASCIILEPMERGRGKGKERGRGGKRGRERKQEGRAESEKGEGIERKEGWTGKGELVEILTHMQTHHGSISVE